MVSPYHTILATTIILPVHCCDNCITSFFASILDISIYLQSQILPLICSKLSVISYITWSKLQVLTMLYQASCAMLLLIWSPTDFLILSPSTTTTPLHSASHTLDALLGKCQVNSHLIPLATPSAWNTLAQESLVFIFPSLFRALLN